MKVVLGRGQIGRLELSHPSISRRHCLVEPRGEHLFRVQDLQSTNGTYEGERRITDEVLRDDTLLILGSYPLKLPLAEVYQMAIAQTPSCPPTSMGGTGALNSPKSTHSTSSTLEHCYQEYQTKLLKGEQSKVVVVGSIRYLPTIAAALLSLLIPRKYMYISAILVLCTLLLSVVLSAWLQRRYIAQLHSLREEFRSRWICPTCQKSLGLHNSWPVLRGQGKCPHCATPWT